jgi:hypothetical protein
MIIAYSFGQKNQEKNETIKIFFSRWNQKAPQSPE